MQKSRGFTLIELIVVLVILGILAAFAIPRFVDLQQEARNATLSGLKGSLHGAASLAHGKQLAKQKLENASVEVQGDNIDMVYGYPDGTDNGIQNLIQDLSGFDVTEDDCSLITNEISAATCVSFVPKGASNTARCRAEYGFNSTGAPEIVVNGTDCS